MLRLCHRCVSPVSSPEIRRGGLNQARAYSGTVQNLRKTDWEELIRGVFAITWQDYT